MNSIRINIDQPIRIGQYVTPTDRITATLCEYGTQHGPRRFLRRGMVFVVTGIERESGTVIIQTDNEARLTYRVASVHVEPY